MFSNKKKSEKNPRRGGNVSGNRSGRPASRPETIDNRKNGRTAMPLRAGSGASGPSIISPDLTVQGSLVSLGDLHIEGSVDGDVKALNLMIGEHAMINGEVSAEDLTIRGRVQGSVRANKVKLAETAHIEGDIIHQSLAVEAGAHFEGQVRHSQDPLSEPRLKRLQAPGDNNIAETNPASGNFSGEKFSSGTPAGHTGGAMTGKEEQSGTETSNTDKPAANPSSTDGSVQKPSGQSGPAQANPFTNPQRSSGGISPLTGKFGSPK